MAWTELDKQNLEDAIRQLIKGERTVSLTTADRSETWQALDLATALKLREQHATELSRPKGRLFLTRHEKGL